MNETLQKATQLLQNGEAEEALLLLNELDVLTTEGEQLRATCKKALSEQYLWLLNDAVKNKQYTEYDKYVQRYLNLIGNDESIARFVNMQDEIRRARNSQTVLGKNSARNVSPLQMSQTFSSYKRKIALIGGVALSLIIIVFCLVGETNTGTKTDLGKADLKGNVKSIAEYAYSLELQDGELVEEPIRFDDERGTVDYTESYYNTDGMLEKYRAIWDMYMNTDTYVYEKGLLKEIKHTFNAERHPEVTRFTYNDKKQLIEMSENLNGNISNTFYAYDAKGNMISDGEYEYIYDGKGRLKKKYSKHYKKEIFSYDKSGKEKEYLIEFSDPTGYYDDSYAEYSVKYDKQGRIIEKNKKNITDGTRTIYKYTYEDDSNGNWVVRTTYIDDKISTRTKRNIKYYDDKEEPLNNLIFGLVERHYESGKPFKDLLSIPEVKEYIVETKSQRFYDLARKYTVEYAILHKDVNGKYYVDAVNGGTGNGTKMYYEDTFTIELFLAGQPTTRKGEFNILPWEKGYYKNYYGEIDENSPVYYLMYPFRYYSESGQSIIENIEFRIDGNGLRFICSSFTNYSHATFRVTKSNGSGWKIPINFTKELVHIGWDNDWSFALLELLYTEESTIEIECSDYAGNKRIYSAEFSPMKQVELVLLEYMFEVGAITDIPPIS